MFKIKEGALEIIKTLQGKGFQSFLVGGSIRDLLLNKEPAEWDITTAAKPEIVSQLFSKVIPTGFEFGTVTILLPDGPYEVTTFRSDEHYFDGRHPQNVVFTDDLHKDLSRRDFTINAIAFDPIKQQLVDDFGGQEDLKHKIIRAVGDPLARFSEDGLRPLRACRFAAKLEFAIEDKTFLAISKTIGTFKKVAPERVQAEIVKMLSSDKPSIGIELMRKAGLLTQILPELEKCLGVEQPSSYHPYDVYWHSLYACDAAPKDNLSVRLAALLHDISKPACKVELTFYNHDQVGAEITQQILKRLKFGNALLENVSNLVLNHMFDYSSSWSDSAVRRFIRRIGGIGNVNNLFLLRKADSKAMHQKIGTDYLKELQGRIDKIIAEENALHVSDLKVNGNDVMQCLTILPGPKVGQILEDLLEKVLDNPALNDREVLLKLIKSHA